MFIYIMRMLKCVIQMYSLYIKNDKYPSKLKQLYDSPPCLYVRGKLPVKIEYRLLLLVLEIVQNMDEA